MDSDNKKLSLGRDVLAYIPVKLMPAITGLLSIIIITRNIAPEEYGRYSVAIASALLLVQLAGAWLANSVLYFYPECKDARSQSEFRRQTINLQLIVAIPAGVVAYLVIHIVTDAQQLALVGGALVFWQLIQGLLMSFLQSSRKIKIQAISVGLQSIAQLGTLCGLIYMVNGKETAAVTAVVIGFFVGSAVLFLINKELRHQNSAAQELISREIFIKIFRYGAPMCLWFFATQFYIVGDRILLQFFGVTEQLGQYASFRDLATGCAGFLTMPLLMASHPIIMAKWKNQCKASEIEAILTNNIVFLTLIFAPLIVMTDVAGIFVINNLFGARYFLSESIMMLIVVSIYIGSISIHLQKGLEVTGKTALMAKIALLTAVFSVGANLILVPKFGVLGGASVVIASGVLYLSLIFFSVRRILLPRISIFFFLKILSWIIAVNLATLLSTKILNDYLDEKSIIIFNFIFVNLATIALLSSNESFRSMVRNRKLWGNRQSPN